MKVETNLANFAFTRLTETSVPQMTMVGAESLASEGGTISEVGGASGWELWEPTVTCLTLLSDWMSERTLIYKFATLNECGKLMCEKLSFQIYIMSSYLMGVPFTPVLGVLRLDPTLEGVP